MSNELKLIKHLKSKSYKPSKANDLAKVLKVKKSDHEDFKKLLNQLEKRGKIACVKGSCYIVPEEADLFAGIIKFKTSGAAVVVPEDKSTDKPITIYVQAHNTSTALHGDRVLVRLDFNSRRRRPKHISPDEVEGKVIKILARASTQVIGTFNQTKTYNYVLPDDPRIIHDIILPSELPFEVKEGDKVVVQLTDWRNRHVSPEGRLVKVLGKTHEPGAEFQAILHKYDLHFDFPKPVEEELESIPSKVTPKAAQGRMDCRKLFTITIDPDDAKDFDDALSFEELDNGDVRVGVHIADVSAYVKSGSALDREAQKRGNSTYLVGTVIPMLPFPVSNGICSLVEGEDRLTKAAFFTYDKKYKVKKVEFANTLIFSRKRLTYHQAMAFLKHDDFNKIRSTPLPPAYQTGSTGRSLKSLNDDEIAQIQKTLRKLWDIASTLRRNRMQKGALDLDMPEVKIFVDEQGRADRIEKIEQDESHQLIEEFMLSANEAVAKVLYDSSMPLISRVHDKPYPERLQELTEFMETFGIFPGDLTNRKHVNKLLHEIKDHPQSYLLKIQFLRSLRQACYRAEADGHYGLNMKHYTHFTSPIRRYSDLITHRLFDAYLYKVQHHTAPKLPNTFYNKRELNSLAEHISLTEQNSTEAERESVKVKLLEFFDNEVHKTNKSILKAIVTDIRANGLFIELSESLAFGFVHLSSMQDDIYKIVNEGQSIIGKNNRRRINVGQEIDVVVQTVDRFKRQMDFMLADSYYGSKKNGKNNSNGQNNKSSTAAAKKKSSPLRRGKGSKQK